MTEEHRTSCLPRLDALCQSLGMQREDRGRDKGRIEGEREGKIEGEGSIGERGIEEEGEGKIEAERREREGY